MNNIQMQEWQSINSQINNITKSFDAKTKSSINDALFKKTSQIMNEQSLSLIYDEYGTQLYEKTSDVHNYIHCQKSGFNTNLNIDDSKLIDINFSNDKYNTDFINYGSFPDIEKKDIKHNMDISTDFKEKNNYLYKVQKQRTRKEDVIKDGINRVKVWFNTEGQNQFKKIKTDFVGFIK